MKRANRSAKSRRYCSVPSAVLQVPTETPRRGSSHHAACRRARACMMLLHCSRLGGRGHVVAMACELREVFKQQVPRVGVGVPVGLEAARDEPGGRRRSDVPVESDLVAARIPCGVGAFGQPGLENERARRVGGCSLIRQAKPDDARQDRGARAFDDHLADAAIANRVGAAERIGEMLGVGRLRQGLRRHARRSNISATTSPIASDAVSPGLSMPYSATSPSCPCVAGPWMAKSGTGSPSR